LLDAPIIARLRPTFSDYQAEDDLVAIYDIDIEMDGDTRASRRLEPIEKRLAGVVKVIRMKRLWAILPSARHPNQSRVSGLNRP
jgi:hypothetical protein